MIMRLPGAYPTRCRAVVHNGIVSMFAISTKKSSSLYEQTTSALAQVDTNLAEVGTCQRTYSHSLSLYHRHGAEGRDEPGVG
jgi:hypothetical protein